MTFNDNEWHSFALAHLMTYNGKKENVIKGKARFVIKQSLIALLFYVILCHYASLTTHKKTRHYRSQKAVMPIITYYFIVNYLIIREFVGGG